jgi:aminoglycoside phosphotransferase (APT) family kinase protein
VQPESYLTYVSSIDTLERFLAMPRGLALPESARNATRISTAIARTVAFGREDDEQCMLHGDAHIGNSYSLPDGTLGLLDWQCVWQGGWAFDVAYVIGSSLSPENRRLHEAALLQHYLDDRARAGWPAPSLTHATNRYRQYLAYGLTVWLTNMPSFQPEQFNTVVASRFAYAMLDHGLLDG